MNTKLLINGELIETQEKQAVINPSTEEVITEVSVASTLEIEAAVHAARSAFDKGQWPRFSLEKRKEFILRIAQGILDNAQELASLETLNTGKPIKESTFMDIPSAAKTFEHFANSLESYLTSETITISAATGSAQSTLLREPLGVAVLIVPWNYPLLIASWKMAQALAAGNTVILKPSSLTPLSALKLAQIIADAGFPKGAVNVINGPGTTVGEMLCRDTRVDMISFTGSNEIGKQIIGNSIGSVKKMSMELGGKSAAIVLKDADLEVAVNGSLCSIFLNQGQMCTAMSRLLVQDEIYDAFLKGFVAKAKRIALGNGSDFETQMGPLISQIQRQKVLAYVKKAESQGAKLLCGGRIPTDSRLRKGFFFEPTVFGEVTPGMTLFQEEVFGPVACVSRFSKVEEAIALANSTEFGLAASIWTKDVTQARYVACGLHAGTVWVNTYGMFYNEVPYGGFKQSGFGKELGKEGFLEYTRLKNFLVDTTEDSKPLVNYWYGF